MFTNHYCQGALHIITFIRCPFSSRRNSMDIREIRQQAQQFGWVEVKLNPTSCVISFKRGDEVRVRRGIWHQCQLVWIPCSPAQACRCRSHADHMQITISHESMHVTCCSSNKVYKVFCPAHAMQCNSGSMCTTRPAPSAPASIIQSRARRSSSAATRRWQVSRTSSTTLACTLVSATIAATAD